MKRLLTIILCALSPVVGVAQDRSFQLSSELQPVKGWSLGVTAPSLEVTLSNEVSGVVDSINKKMGARFEKGETLVVFDCRLLELQREKASAVLALKHEQFRVLEGLFELGSIGAEDVAIASSELKSAEVDFEVANYSVGKCTVAAPFAGIVAEIMVAPHEYTEARTLLMRLFQTDVIDAKVSVPFQNIDNLGHGAEVSIVFDPTRSAVLGVVYAVSPEINSVSQLVDVLIRIKNPPVELKHGATVAVDLR